MVRSACALTIAGFMLMSTAAQAQPGYYPPPPLPYPPPPDYGHSDPYRCDMYARDQAHRYAPPGSAVGGAVRGAVGGAVFGAIVGGKKGARRGAAAGGGLGLVANGARAQREREYAYRYAYDDCMRGFRR
jgi:hypothetical protein